MTHLQDSDLRFESLYSGCCGLLGEAILLDDLEGWVGGERGIFRGLAQELTLTATSRFDCRCIAAYTVPNWPTS